MGRWEAMQDTETGEFTCYSWSEEQNIGKKLLLPTLLHKKPAVQNQDSPPDCLRYLDLFQRVQEAHSQPWAGLSHTHHMQPFNEMYHVHVLLKTLAAWRELHDDEEKGTEKG